MKPVEVDARLSSESRLAHDRTHPKWLRRKWDKYRDRVDGRIEAMQVGGQWGWRMR